MDGMFQFLVMLGTSLVVVQLVMLLCWIYYLLRRSINVVDIGWGIGFIAGTMVYFVLADGFFWRKLLILLLVTIWAARLTRHLIHRALPEQEDPRYVLLSSWWPCAGFQWLQVLTLCIVQGLLITVLSLPFAFLSHNLLPFFSTCEVFGLLIWMVGIVGEAVSDRQLETFKQNRAHIGLVCDQGWWKTSRHPNYFFEWVMWVGFGVMALSSPYGWIGLISPILMLYLLLFVTGIPLNEAQALKSKGDAYREYQRRTSSFFPWF